MLFACEGELLGKFARRALRSQKGDEQNAGGRKQRKIAK
jgi:hypothetical protein